MYSILVSNRLMRLPIAIVTALVLGSPSLPAQEPAESTGQLDLTVIVVARDLTLKPVPKWVFETRSTDTGVTYSLATGFDGRAELSLPPGSYEISSARPLPFEDQEFTWRVGFAVVEGEVTTLELSNDNVVGRPASAPVEATAVHLSEGELYRQVQHSVFKVISETGHGSGFLVHPWAGIVLTNHHVVANSDYLAVLVSPGNKHSAQLLAFDEVNDVAVLQVHPRLVEGLSAPLLASDEPAAAPVDVGDTVVAVGSPLATETILTSGLVSKVEDGAIYSDVNINPGNSGGPLFNLHGEVVGISTFGLSSGGVSPGLAGIVRVHLAEAVVAEALESPLLNSPPTDRKLAVESETPFPAEALRELVASGSFTSARQARVTGRQVKEYKVEAGKFDVQLITPVLTAALEVADEREAAGGRTRRNKRKQAKDYAVGDHFYEWRRYAGDYRAVVTIQVVPEIRLTTGSIFGSIAGGLTGVATPQKYRFKTDFDRMVLLRDGVEVEPIWPGRVANVVHEEGFVSMKDVGYYGIYEYPPEAFKPPAELTMKIWKQGVQEPIVKVIPQQRQWQVWEDFRLYFEAVENRAAAVQ